jgi:hypothetical protein
MSPYLGLSIGTSSRADLICQVGPTPQGADPLPPASKPVTAGRNHLNK